MCDGFLEVSDETLAAELVGKTIVSVDKGKYEVDIELDDGTVLVIENNHEYWNWFDVYDVPEINLVNTPVTEVREVMTTMIDPEEDAFDVVVLSGDTTVIRMQIDGYLASGVYCHSVALSVGSKEEME